MSNINLTAKRLRGLVIPPPDKSISHRAIIIACLAQGKTQIRNLSQCADCRQTLQAFSKMGISARRDKDLLYIQGKGLEGLRRPAARLYLGNSGTSMRLILGVLAGQKQGFTCVLTGDASLCRRPMKRVILPLSLMGAKVQGQGKAGEFAPLSIRAGGRRLKPIYYRTPVASAQVKSAVLLAALYARGVTSVREPVKSRDHTERLLKRFGAKISVTGCTVFLQGRAHLIPQDIDIPGDISAASFFLVGATIAKGSQILVKSVGLNPTRTAFLSILQEMGAKLRVSPNCQDQDDSSGDEPQGEISARYSKLRALRIKPKQIPALIDELPILMVAATQAEGTTIIQGAGELRFKETDRIKAMVVNLGRLGAEINSCDNDVIIRGPARLRGCKVDSFGDHRIAMSMAIAALVAGGGTTIKNADCVNVSYPGFFKTLSRLVR